MSRVRLSAGTRPDCPQLARLATSRPFVHQIDIVLPAHAAPDHAFTALKTTYSTAECTLSELYEHASRLATPDVLVRPFTALPIERDADDTWCIDPRGILTLSISKDLYEQLGLIGTRLAFKGCPERYVIRVPLKRETAGVKTQARHRAALALWDRTRATQGRPRWRVAYLPSTPTPTPTLEGCTVVDVTPTVRRDPDVHVPHFSALVQAGDDTTADHHERVEALCEWVGMACLGAQRLRTNDRVDAYVALYAPPEPASIGDVVHVRWKGCMGAEFVQSVIDTATAMLATSMASGDKGPFVAVTLHSSRMTPVSYLPASPAKEAPPRLPGPDAEDTVCVLLSKSTWAMVESIGKWDARWG